MKLYRTAHYTEGVPPVTQFHETVRRWIRNRSRYGPAALLGVMLIAVLSAVLTVLGREAESRETGDAREAKRQGDIREEGAAKPLMTGDELRKLGQLRPEEKAENALWVRRLGFIRIMKALHQDRRRNGRPLPSASAFWLVSQTLALLLDVESFKGPDRRSTVYDLLLGYLRTGDPTGCNDWLQRINLYGWMLSELEPLVPVLEDTTRQPECWAFQGRLTPEMARQDLPVLLRSVNELRAWRLARSVRVAVFLGMFGVVKRYRMWLRHEAWWMP